MALREHLSAVQSEDTLFGGVLIHSYALAEAAASDRLGVSSRTFTGIEDWGTRLLASNGETWDGVKDGLAGAVEVAVVRNAYAHGARDLDRGAAKRLRTAGRAEAATGDPVNLDYATLKRFRWRLRNLLGAGGVGRAS